MKERKIMSNDGIVVVIANIDTKNKELLGNPNITTRGFVQIQENIELLKEIEKLSRKIILNKITKYVSFNEIKSELINELSTFINEKTGRNPVIMPVMIDIKRENK